MYVGQSGVQVYVATGMCIAVLLAAAFKELTLCAPIALRFGLTMLMRMPAR